jgi:hypothetical protein
VFSELEFWRIKLHSRLDQFIKTQVQKRGMTIIENSYTSFDSEYEVVKFSNNENRLISMQTAVQRRTIVKIPLVEPFDITYVNPLSYEISNTYKNNVRHKYTFVPDVMNSPLSKGGCIKNFK